MTLASLFSEHISILAQGYENALVAAGLDGVVLYSGHCLRQRSVDDQFWPLTVNPSFAHWLPLLEPEALLIVRPGERPLLLRPKSESFWEGEAPIPGDGFFFANFRVESCTPEAMKERLGAGRLGFIGDGDLAFAQSLGIAMKDCNEPTLMRSLDALRAMKTSYEVECIAQASQIAARGHVDLHSEFHRDHYSELDLHLRYLQVTQQDAWQTPYGNIVAQGAHAAILHHIHYSRFVDTSADQSLLVDAGASYLGYASDITRTTVRGEGAAACAFRSLIDGLDHMQQELCAMAVPGLAYERLHNKAHEKLATLLIASGLCTGSAEALVELGVTRAFFPHGLGHSLGLQVHDVGCRLIEPSEKNPFLRNTSTISKGQVFTIEPGCYFIEALLLPLQGTEAGSYIHWPTVDALSPFGGIRIEDNLLVGSSASINLTRDNWSPTHVRSAP